MKNTPEKIAFSDNLKRFSRSKRKVYTFLYCKKRFLVLLSMVTLLSLLGCDNKFKLYHSASYGINIKYPKTWKMYENVDGAAAIFVSPKETSLDVYSENLSIVVQPLSGRIVPLVEYTQQAIYQLTHTVDNIKVISSAPAHLSGSPAHRFEYFVTGRQKLKVMHIWMIKDKISYQITFGCDVDRCGDYMPIVTEMINSFEFD